MTPLTRPAAPPTAIATTTMSSQLVWSAAACTHDERGDDGGEAHDRADREVDAARRDDEGHADADHADDRGEADDREEVLDVHEAVARGDGADDDEQRERDDEAEVAPGGTAHESLNGVARLLGRGRLRRRRRLADGGGGLLAHAAVPFMTRSSTPCSSISVAGVSWRTRPSPMTSTRSARPSTSGISLDTTTIAVPASASRRMRA